MNQNDDLKVCRLCNTSKALFCLGKEQLICVTCCAGPKREEVLPKNKCMEYAAKGTPYKNKATIGSFCDIHRKSLKKRTKMTVRTL